MTLPQQDRPLRAHAHRERAEQRPHGAPACTTTRPPLHTAGFYVLFAAISIVANLASQEAVYRVAPLWQLEASILAGTIVGFTVKYLLDKHYIFFDRTTTRDAEIGKILRYGIFSVFTTLVFWAFEFAFFHVWGTTLAKYLGAVIGLTIGYVIKYFLDRRYTFTQAGMRR